MRPGFDDFLDLTIELTFGVFGDDAKVNAGVSDLFSAFLLLLKLFGSGVGVRRHLTKELIQKTFVSEDGDEMGDVKGKKKMIGKYRKPQSKGFVQSQADQRHCQPALQPNDVSWPPPVVVSFLRRCAPAAT